MSPITGCRRPPTFRDRPRTFHRSRHFSPTFFVSFNSKCHLLTVQVRLSRSATDWLAVAGRPGRTAESCTIHEPAELRQKPFYSSCHSAAYARAMGAFDFKQWREAFYIQGGPVRWEALNTAARLYSTYRIL